VRQWSTIPGPSRNTATALILQGFSLPLRNTIRHSSRNGPDGATAAQPADSADAAVRSARPSSGLRTQPVAPFLSAAFLALFRGFSTGIGGHTGEARGRCGVAFLAAKLASQALVTVAVAPLSRRLNPSRNRPPWGCFRTIRAVFGVFSGVSGACRERMTCNNSGWGADRSGGPFLGACVTAGASDMLPVRARFLTRLI